MGLGVVGVVGGVYHRQVELLHSEHLRCSGLFESGHILGLAENYDALP